MNLDMSALMTQRTA